MGEGLKRARKAAKATRPRKPRKDKYIEMSPPVERPKHKSDKPIEMPLTDDAKVVLGAWFGMMKPGGKSALTLHLRESKPTLRAQAALDELVEAGAIKRIDPSPEYDDGVRYEPLIENTFDYFKWLMRNKTAGTKFKLMEKVEP